MRFLRAVLPLLFFSHVAYGGVLIKDGPAKDGPLCPRLDANMCLSVGLEGEIVQGDAAALEDYLRALRSVPDVRVRVGYVHLNSLGGDLREAMKLGEILRAQKIQTVVALPDKCHSACVLVLAGGVGRIPFGEVGIHSFYSIAMTKDGFDYDKEDKRYRAVSAEVAAYLERMRVPRELLDEMIKTPPSVMKVLQTEDTNRLGLFGFDPVFHQMLVTKGYLSKKK